MPDCKIRHADLSDIRATLRRAIPLPASPRGDCFHPEGHLQVNLRGVPVCSQARTAPSVLGAPSLPAFCHALCAPVSPPLTVPCLAGSALPPGDEPVALHVVSSHLSVERFEVPSPAWS